MYDLRSILQRPTDLEHCGVTFHSYVLKIYSDPYSAHANLLSTIECKDPKLWQEFKDIIYGVKQKISPELSNEEIFELYQIFEYLLIDAGNAFHGAKSYLLLAHLKKQSIRFDLRSSIIDVLKGTIDHIPEEEHYLPFVIFTEKALQQIRAMYLKSLDRHRFNYACMLWKKLGGPEDLPLARKLFLQEWEERKDHVALHNYTCMVFYGSGGPADPPLARRLFEQNWEENRNKSSLVMYIRMLRNGSGGPKDIEQADCLQAVYNSMQ